MTLAGITVFGSGTITFVGEQGRESQVIVNSTTGWQVVNRASNFEVAPGVFLGSISQIRAETTTLLVVDDVTVQVTDAVQPEGGVIAGRQFLDLDSDGDHDPGEPGLDGWTIRLFDEAGSLVAEQVTSTQDADGNGVIEPAKERGLYRFTGLAPGTYRVDEVHKEGWTQTIPGEPVFGMRADIEAGRESRSLVGADFDGDGDVDLAVLNQFDRTVSLLRNSNRGDGAFESWGLYSVNGNPQTIVAEDFDSDRDIDLAYASDGTFSILWNNSGGGFRVPEAFPARLDGDHTFGNVEVVSLVAGDLDRDGDIDLAAGDAGNQVIRILWNDSLARRSVIGLGSGDPEALVAADLDGDGDLDLASSNRVGGFASVLVFRYLANLGGFTSGQDYFLPQAARSLATGDLDSDGDFDLIAGGNTGLSVLWNNGRSRFEARSDFEARGPVFSVAPADLDGDGDLDLAVSSFNHTIEVWRNDEGAVAPFASYQIGNSPYAVLATDVDGDGDLDLASANFGGPSVSVLRNLTASRVATLTTEQPVMLGLDFGNTSRFQVVTVGRDLTAVEGSRIRVPVQYTTTDRDATLSGLGLRLHFDSTLMTFDGLTGLLATNHVQQQVLADTANFDDDPTTDRFLLISWSDLQGLWPNEELSAVLYHAHFRLTAGATAGETTTIRFTSSSNAVTHGFAGIPSRVEIVPASLDVDANGVADALSDGTLIIRSLFGMTGLPLTTDAVAFDAARTVPDALQDYIEQLATVILDADGNGAVNALTDGLLIQRYLFGYRGASLVNGVADPIGLRR